MGKKIEVKGDYAFTTPCVYGSSMEPMYSGANSFLRRKYTKQLENVDVAVSGVCYDCATTNRPGARFGPQAIRLASANLAWAPHYPTGLKIFDNLAVVDYGDALLDPGMPLEVPNQIEEHAKEILKSNAKMLTFGGDHFITYPILKAHYQKYGQLALIHFDAHSDTWAEKTQRIDHGTMFYHAAKQGIISAENSIQVGIRTHNSKTHGFNILPAHELHQIGIEQSIQRIKQIAKNTKLPVYLTFDIDALDPSFAPGTGTPVCGGLSTHQSFQILQSLSSINLIGADVVEVAPAYDVSQITALAGANIALEILRLFALNKQNQS